MAEAGGAAAAAPPDIDPDFEPQSRPRSCTWPLPRPELPAGAAEAGGAGAAAEEGSGGAAAAAAGPGRTEGARAGGGGGAAAARKGGSRRNAWGNQSYAELISQAIESAPEKRLTLAQIYEWMVRSVPYFKDKGDSNSSAGWKNSIRHNLSLHSKFIKVHNEATGKSSWWMLNPEGGKSGKAPRRRAASMDNSSKLAKVRSKASKKKPPLQSAPEATADSPGSQFPKWPGSPSSRSNEDSDVWNTFRPRTSSNASTISARLSPILTEQDDLHDEELLPSMVYSSASSNVPPTVTEELELIDGLNLMSPSSSVLSAQQSASSGQIQRDSSFSLRSPNAAGQTTTFGNSLFNPVEMSLQSSVSHFSGPQTLEALLTPGSPPPRDVLMTQVDPVLPQTGGRMSSRTLLLLGGQSTPSKMSSGNARGKPAEQQAEPVGATVLPSTLPIVASPQNTASINSLKAPVSATAAQSVQLGSPPLLSSAGPAPLGLNQDRLPIDLDIDMYMENLECDMDYIINSELMDGEGLDFNFEPVPSTPSYPSSSQASSHTWVPS
ncbi:forkhead box protein O4 [Tympanuchus pallidicinctus]|uniref:forkhead box protein O4 n=1 Tax=Tympanuchus pallidicinctus TaxID=109042 RepID=UPI0022874B33|nr:forkhead box protein O4 [Tympanuchus pallidicinctus]